MSLFRYGLPKDMGPQIGKQINKHAISDQLFEEKWEFVSGAPDWNDAAAFSKNEIVRFHIARPNPNTGGCAPQLAYLCIDLVAVVSLLVFMSLHSTHDNTAQIPHVLLILDTAHFVFRLARFHPKQQTKFTIFAKMANSVLTAKVGSLLDICPAVERPCRGHSFRWGAILFWGRAESKGQRKYIKPRNEELSTDLSGKKRVNKAISLIAAACHFC